MSARTCATSKPVTGSLEGDQRAAGRRGSRGFLILQLRVVVIGVTCTSGNVGASSAAHGGDAKSLSQCGADTWQGGEAIVMHEIVGNSVIPPSIRAIEKQKKNSSKVKKIQFSRSVSRI
ncbi:hypothetical protein AXG93_4492s1260 [Marchantia polymorpha subsp. ruderalis]|uniref:Uncharacterized protein n=1 Tax=Marchantia polymorpha subsp. ruderalis TaxID=1480154 RepID=A0A176W770_MARPO|nr:hypothetical protein AXG93_4492s1260 [Marchantia polymorpha subsp. ruderalis]